MHQASAVSTQGIDEQGVDIVSRNVLSLGAIRNNFSCSPISMFKGTMLPWVSEIGLRYLGIYIKQYTNFKCSIDHAKRSFYRSANAIFGRVGRIASEHITLQLINTNRGRTETCYSFARGRPCLSKQTLSGDWWMCIAVFLCCFKDTMTSPLPDARHTFNLTTIRACTPL